MKGRTIMPQVVGARRLPGGNVRNDPIDPIRADPEPLFRFLEGIRRKIEYRYPAEALLKQAINKP